jgi:hypothetical protein
MKHVTEVDEVVQLAFMTTPNQNNLPGLQSSGVLRYISRVVDPRTITSIRNIPTIFVQNMSDSAA